MWATRIVNFCKKITKNPKVFKNCAVNKIVRQYG